MEDWQPIETAPREGWALLTYAGGDETDCVIAARNGDKWLDCHCFEVAGPTHWMPLPTPPKEAVERE